MRVFLLPDPPVSVFSPELASHRLFQVPTSLMDLLIDADVVGRGDGAAAASGRASRTPSWLKHRSGPEGLQDQSGPARTGCVWVMRPPGPGSGSGSTQDPRHESGRRLHSLSAVFLPEASDLNFMSCENPAVSF